MTSDQACVRQAARDNLVAELTAAVRAFMDTIHYAQDKEALIAGIKNADALGRAALAKVQQS